MTKAEWISVIKNTLVKVDEQSRLREPLLERHIQSVYEQMYNESYNRDKRGMWKYVRRYQEIAPGDGIELTGTGHTPTYLPISLLRPSSGLFKVKSSNDEFILTDPIGVDNVIDSSFDTVGLMDRYVATMMGDKIYGNTTITTGQILTYWIIPKFTTLSSSDEVMIPDGMEDHFIDRVIDTIQHAPPTDLINDNTI